MKFKIYIVRMRIREGDPLEIYTDHDGSVIFKKYSPVGELGSFAAELCESLYKTTGSACAVSDRDSIVAVSGAPKKALLDEGISPELERVLGERRIYKSSGSERIAPVKADSAHFVSLAAPIVSQGDLLGSVMFLGSGAKAGSETEYKLAQAAATFLGKQMEG